MGFKINWKSISQWAGTEKVEHEGEEIYETREEAEAARAAMEEDRDLMQEVFHAAVEGQGVEGWLEVEEE
jgi:hypothetical protein